MSSTTEDKEYYEFLERQIVKEATTNGILFEEVALLKRDIKNEGLRGFAFCEMLRSKLAEKLALRKK